MFSQKVDDLVERIENIIRAFFEVKHVDDVEVEKYRQDAASVTASWTSSEWASIEEGALSRNIVLLVEESKSGCSIDFEANAWLDNTTTLKRRWVHRTLGTLWVEPYTEEKLPVAVGITLEKIFNGLSVMRIEELTETAELQTLR